MRFALMRSRPCRSTHRRRRRIKKLGHPTPGARYRTWGHASRAVDRTERRIISAERLAGHTEASEYEPGTCTDEARSPTGRRHPMHRRSVEQLDDPMHGYGAEPHESSTSDASTKREISTLDDAGTRVPLGRDARRTTIRGYSSEPRRSATPAHRRGTTMRERLTPEPVSHVSNASTASAIDARYRALGGGCPSFLIRRRRRFVERHGRERIRVNRLDGHERV